MPRKSLSGIYRIVNIVNGKVYIGSASCLGGRKKAHEYRLKAGNHHGAKLQRAWNKYGESAFKFEVIEYVSGENSLLEKEQYWIDHHESATHGYNIAAIAGRTVGITWSEEQKLKASESRKGIKHSPEHIAAVRLALTGNKLSDETRRKISEKAKVRFSDPEQRAKIGAANSGRKPSNDVREKMSLSQKASWTDERRTKQSKLASGRAHSEETKAKIADSNRRRVYSSETLLKMSESAKRTSARKRIEKESENG